MKRTLLFMACLLASITMQAQEYFPEGTKWTEIRLDTLKYDSWYSKVGDEWVPNFETIEYYVEGNYSDKDMIFKKVYTNGLEWTDSLTLLIQESDNTISVSPWVHNYEGTSGSLWPGMAYQFDWSVGKGIYYEDILLSNTTTEYPYHYYYGIIDEIKEGQFGGVRPLKYVDLDGKAPVNPQEPGNRDTNGGRIIQGIGVTEWNDGECLFGPPAPYRALSMYDSYQHPERHYRSMLVHFERNGEVLYDMMPDILPPNDYYYYQGNKIPLTLNEYKVVVSIPKDRGDIIERLKTNIQTLGIIGDTTFDIYVVQRSEYDKLTTLDFWSEDAKSVILTSSYIIESNEEVYATPYLNVRLKKEEDIALLTSYADQYKLTIVNNSPLMPLWYILAITPESKKNNLVCANELYESGDFAASTPDLAEGYSPQIAYRPFVEDGKVWKVGVVNTGNPVQVVEYYYFDGDTIIDGKTCKQMMCQRYVNPEYAVNHNISQDNPLSYVGAWYEENQKVYEYDTTNKLFKLMYDFSLDNDGIYQINGLSYALGPKQTGGIKGFKGIYREVRMCAEEGFINSVPWLEGVGGTDGPTINVYAGYVEPLWVLMSCTVGDEVIYFNDEFEDGATPEDMEAQKHRFDFTHTTKLQPKIPTRREEEQTIYGEYNDFQLGINLEPIDDTYLVSITDASGKVVYEKNINAGNIVGLNIDISNYPKGLYTVTVENSLEVFTGEFEAQATGIEEVRCKKEEVRSDIFNLQGQRISSLQKGLNIINGQKVFIK